jgi:hypothetical protein
MPDQALNLPAVVIEVVATSHWCSPTNKYVHNTSAFYLALGQACRKRRVLDGAYTHLGLGLPPTRAIVVVTLCCADHDLVWQGLEEIADLCFVTVRYQGHLFPTLPFPYMQNGMLY